MAGLFYGIGALFLVVALIYGVLRLRAPKELPLVTGSRAATIAQEDHMKSKAPETPVV
ncbi:MAG TPA: hypothetical protein VGF56_08215 [Rhizomicrobium sp.]|jgi:hypothetical protein